MKFKEVTSDMYEAHLVQKQELTPTVLLTRFALEAGQKFIFKSGQYILLKITLPDGQVVERPFSIASSPHQQQEIELLIRLQSTGIVSDFFRTLLPGTKINFSGPMGRFLLQSEVRPIHFIASGVGIAPFRSMLNDLLSVRRVDIPIQLSFVKESSPWASLDAELVSWVEKCRNFGYSYIHPSGDIVDTTAVWARILLNNPRTHVYLCGAPTFVAEGKAWLLQQGIPAEAIFHEN